jgi:DNA topoisomerase-1
MDDAKSFCRLNGLIYVETSALTISRRRYGKGFAYRDPDGRILGGKTNKARIAALAIPPAWTEVAIAEDPKAHIQAIGRDAEGRLQYRYHPDWERFRAERKGKRLQQLGAALPRLRAAVRNALSRPGWTRSKVVAAAVRLIDRALIRPGHEEYAQNGGGRGAATLLKSDVRVNGDTVTLDFTGKGGKEISREVEDKLLARVLKRLARRRGKRLFVAPDENGGERPITAREVNAFLAEAAGQPISAKDFRTFRASATALGLLAEADLPESERSRRRAVAAAADEASKLLANTRTVARSSYIHPEVIAAYESGALEPSLLRGHLRNGLSRIESALMRFLEGGRWRKPASRRSRSAGRPQ